MSDNDKLETKILEVLLKEHEELLNLISYEGNVFWRLTSIYLTISLGLTSAIAILLSIKGYLVILLCFSGSIISLIWYFLLKRSQVYFLTRRNRAIELEQEIQKKGFPFDTLSSTSQLIKQGRFIDFNGKTKSLPWTQKYSVPKNVTRGTLVMTVVWLGITFFLLFSPLNAP